MDLHESLRQAVEVLGDHPRRVVASSLGVFWGAAGIVLLLAMGTGFRDYMKDELGRFGKSSVMMIPARPSKLATATMLGWPCMVIQISPACALAITQLNRSEA